MKCENPKCEEKAEWMGYCNNWCYRDHLQQLQDAGEFDEPTNVGIKG